MPFKKGHKINIGKKFTLDKHWKLSNETKQRMSKVKKGQQFTQSHSQHISNALKGKSTWSSLNRQSMSKKLKGRVSPMKGRLQSTMSKRQMSLNNARYWQGKHRDADTNRKIGEANKGLCSGNKHYLWIEDRSKLKGYDDEDRRSSAYKYWRNCVYKRDAYRCKINDIECKGRLEVHHIIGYTKFPTLRYDINNGITLCHAHHPRKRSEEAKLSPFFQKLVAEMK